MRGMKEKWSNLPYGLPEFWVIVSDGHKAPLAKYTAVQML